MYTQNIMQLIKSCKWLEISKHIDYAALSAPGSAKTLTYISSQNGSNFKISIKKSLEIYLEEILIHVLPFETLGFLFARFSHSQEDLQMQPESETENYVRNLK